METCILISPMPNLPPCQASVSSTGSGEANGKKQYPEGEFAALLAALQKQPAETVDSEQLAEKQKLIVPAALQFLIQPVCPSGASGEAGILPVASVSRQAESGTALTAGYEIAGLSGALTTELLPSLAAVEGKQAAVSGAAVINEPALTAQNVQKGDHATVARVGLGDAQPAVGTLTEGKPAGAPAEPKQAAASGTAVMDEPALAAQNVQKGDHVAVARVGFSGTQPSLATTAEGKLVGAPEQEKGETRLADNIAQPSVRPVWPAHEQLQAEAARRHEAVKSAVLEQVLEKMVFSQSESGEAKVYVRLKPPSLGEVEISLYLEDGRLTGRIIAESAMVRELLDASLSQLRQRLEEQNVHVAELTISTGQERGFRRGRDRPDGMSIIPAGREMSMESASAVPTALPGLLNALV